MLSQHRVCSWVRSGPAWFRKSAGRTIWLSSVLGLCSACIALQPQQMNTGIEAPLLGLAANETRALTLEPGHPQSFTLTVPAGRMTLLTLEQKMGMSGMIATCREPSDAAEEPLAYMSDGGVGSQVRLALFGTDHEIAYTVTFKTREKRRPSEAELSLTPLIAPRDADRALAHVEAEYARAEAIRRGILKGDTAEAANLYDAAIGEASKLRGSVSVVTSQESLERRAWIGKARLLMYREEDYLGAEKAAQRAVNIAQENQNASLAEAAEMALAWKTYSSALALLNRYDEAVDAGRRALTLYEQTGDEYWQGVVVGNLAFVYRETGQTAKAMEAAEQSLRLAERQKDDYGRAFALSAEGAISQGSGDYQAALDRYYRALDVLEVLKTSMPHSQVEGEVWSNVGEIYADLGDWEQAENAYRHALPVLQATSDGVNEIEVAGRLAGAEIHAGKLDAAKADYQVAIKRADELGLQRQKSHLLTGLARAEAALAEEQAKPESQFAAASALFKQAEATARAIHQIDGEAEALAGQGDLLSIAGKRAEARSAYMRSAELWNEIPNNLEAARAGANLARLERLDGQLDQARRQIFAVLDQVEKARATLASESLRTAYFSSRHSFYELAVDVLMDLDARTPGRGYAAQAWEVAERARARTLRDELAAGAKASELDEKQEALELRIRESEDRLAHLGTTKEDAAKAEEAGRELHQLLLEADRAAQEARSRRQEGAVSAEPRSASATGLGSVQVEIAIPEPRGGESTELNASVQQVEAQVAKSLGRDSALFEFWTGIERSYLWVIRPGATGSELRAYTLPSAAALENRVNQYMGAVLERERELSGRTGAQRELRLAAADRRASQLGEELGRLLFPLTSAGVAQDSLRRLVVVPDGPLEKLPFAALQVPITVPESDTRRPDSSNSAAAARRFSYLVQRYELVEEPSATALSQLGTNAKSEGRQQPEAVAVFADPVYSKTDPRLKPADLDAAFATAAQGVLRQAGDGIALPQLPRLPGSKREAMNIRQIAGPQNTALFLDFEASPETLAKMDWSKYRVLHIAAHAIANREQPELSGIALSMVKQDGSAVNGIVRLHDVYRLHTPVELVVLSACSTSGGKNIIGEGVENLARAFLVAGSRSVLAMQWGADDASTTELMRAFYNSYLLADEPSPAALRDAQIRLIEDPRYAAPYYWAGAVLEGNWRGR